jgi:hypothetical protein
MGHEGTGWEIGPHLPPPIRERIESVWQHHAAMQLAMGSAAFDKSPAARFFVKQAGGNRVSSRILRAGNHVPKNLGIARQVSNDVISYSLRTLKIRPLP